MSRYERQTCLPDFGEEGQRKLKASAALVVGAGGLGSPVIQYLAGAGLGSVDVVDSDTVDLTNLHRQTLYTQKSIGLLKAKTAAERIRALGVRSEWESEKLQDVRDHLGEYQVVLDCTDRWSSHDEVASYGREYKVPVVHGSIGGLLGRVMVFGVTGPCWRCVHPSRPETTGSPPGTVGPVCGVVGSMMAFEALRILLGWGERVGQMSVYNAMTADTRSFQLTVRPGCEEH